MKTSLNAIIGISTMGSIAQPKQGADRQMMGSALALDKKGVGSQVINLMWGSPNWEGKDILHLFNSGGPNGPYAQVIQTAKEKGIPVVTTPVYWPVDELKQEVESIYGEGKKQYELYLESFKPVLRQSDVLLPNSEAEMQKVKEYLDYDNFDYEVIPNAVNSELTFAGHDMPEIEKAKQSEPPPWGDYVICPARIEPRKNQWRLLQAMKNLWDKGLDKKLVFIGGVKEEYLSQFKDEMEGENVILDPGEQPPEKILASIYHADLMCLPSFIETPGLVALEALALGTNIAITDRGSTKEYFGPHVPYCDPLDSSSISSAIEEGLNDDQSEIMDIVKSKMTYDRVSDLYLKIYREVIEKNGQD